MSCEHQWEGLSAWGGRYRCSLCGAFGYHVAETPCSAWQHNAGQLIIPYLCKVKGCGNPAVAKDPTTPGASYRQWRCRDHRTQYAKIR
jgi:hypothetical protein